MKHGDQHQQIERLLAKHPEGLTEFEIAQRLNVTTRLVNPSLMYLQIHKKIHKLGHKRRVHGAAKRAFIYALSSMPKPAAVPTKVALTADQLIAVRAEPEVKPAPPEPKVEEPVQPTEWITLMVIGTIGGLASALVVSLIARHV